MRPQRIDIASPLYPSEVALRDRVLRAPAGRGRTAADFDRDREGHHFVIAEGDEVVACLILQPAGAGECALRSVAVAPHRRRAGLASALLAFAEADLVRRGGRSVVVDARVDALAFYEANGYRFSTKRFLRHGLVHARGWKVLGDG